MKKVKKKDFFEEIDDNINKRPKDKNVEKKNLKEKKRKIVDDEFTFLDEDNELLKEINEEKEIIPIKEKKKDKFKKKDKQKEEKLADTAPLAELAFLDEANDLLKEDNPDNESSVQEKPKKKLFSLFKKKDKKEKVKKEKIGREKKHPKKEVIEVADESILEEPELLKEDAPKKEKHSFFKRKKKPKIVINRFDRPKKENKHVKEKGKKERPKKRPFWKKLLTFILIMCIIGVLAVAAFLTYIVITAPEFNESDLAIKDQSVVYDIDGNIIAKLGTQKRESITYDQLPQVLIDAIIATEDSRYFQHNGVDLFRFMKATVLQALGQDDAGGASTLTMQTVKNNITKKEKTTEGTIEKIIRKFQDVYLAVFKLEKEYSKEEILEMYVNDNGLGSSYYGVEEASKYYFGKSAAELSLPEAALIAGLFQAPNRHNPYNDLESATKRRRTVLNLMVKHGYITKEEKELAEKIPIESLLVGANNKDNKYQGYIDTVVTEVEELTDTDPYTTPMKIYTTMERSIQDGISSLMLNNDEWFWKDEKVQAGVAVINADTGAIAAVGSGRNRTGERQFNYATQAYRQPGSTAKPIFDYGPGIEYNNFSSYTLFMDEPWSYTNGPNVNNWDGGYMGLITTRQALQVSRNVPALKAFQRVGPRNSQEFAYALGLDVSLNSSSENYKVYENGIDNTINEAYSIGGAAKGFTPLNMATAYACFANGGYYTKPHTVTKIVFRETGEEKEYKYTKERVMKDSTAYIMNNILESAVTSGFNGGAGSTGGHAAAKTGTSNYDEATMQAKGMPGSAVNDLWTVAYTSQYSVAVWYGYDEADPNYYNDWGGYKDGLTEAVMHFLPVDYTGWSMPSSVVAVTVENGTSPAQLPSEFTPGDMLRTEYFVRGTQPTEVSERYAKLNGITNLKSTKVNSNTAKLTWDYQIPRILTREYLESYFSDPAYGNSRGNFVNDRMNYNSNVLGDVGFAIYKEGANGALTLVDFVKDKEYTYKGYGSANLVVKAEHANFKSNASDGTKITVNLDELNVNNINATFLTNGAIQAKVGEYEEKGFKSITYGNMDITNSVTIIYSISGDTNVYTTAKEFETFVNTLPAGTYTITYTITYQGKELQKSRSLILS